MESTRIIKRYNNRKLYDTQNSVYVTLEELHGIFKNTENVKVIDQKTQNDITCSVMLFCIMNKEEKKPHAKATLLEAIKSNHGTFSGFLNKEDEKNIAMY